MKTPVLPLSPRNRALGALSVLLFLAVSVGAQQIPGLGVSSYAGQNVSGVDVAGRPGVSYETVQNEITVKPNHPLSEQDVNTSVAALKRQTGVNSVTVDLTPSADGVEVEFVLEPAMWIGMYDFPGALKPFSYSRLLQVANYNPQTPYDASDVNEARDALEHFYQQHGYFLAEVNPQLQQEEEHGLINVQFRTNLGKHARIGKVNLVGASPQETDYLQGKLRSVMARMRGVSLKTGKPYSYGRMKKATAYLQEALSKQEYIAAQVNLVSAEYDRDTNRADITFHIDLGPKVKVTTEGAKLNGLFHPRTMQNLVPMYAENAVDEELIREGQQNILSYFQKKGYFDAAVDVKEDKTPQGMNIVYQIHKNQRFAVEDVTFQGNRHFSGKELASHVSVKQEKKWLPGFSHGTYSQQLVRNSVKNLSDTYKAAGYSEVQVVPKVARDKGNIYITFAVTEGPLNTVNNLTIEGNNTLPPSQFAPHGTNLGHGKPYSTELVAKDRSLIIANYLTRGYLNASFTATATPVSKGAHQVNVVYHIEEGPRVQTAAIITVGRQHTKQTFVDRTVQLKSGEPLRENSMLAAESRLYDEGIFDWAEVDPKRTITDETHRSDVVVKLHEAKRNSMVFGFGLQVLNRGGSVPNGSVAVPGLPVVGLPNNFVTSQKTFWGPDATFEFTRRNMRGRAETLNFSSFVGRLDQRGSITYTDPAFRGTNWQTTALISAEHDSENPIFTDRIGNVGYELQHPLNRATLHGKHTTNLFVRYNYQYTFISNLLIPQLVPANQLNVHLSTVSVSWVRDTRDDVLDAHRGIYLNYQLSASPKWLGSNFSFAEFTTQSAYYKNIGKGIIWANSLRVGLEQPFSNSEVPLSSRFFAGGGSTLRGFPLNGAGPQETIAACGNPNDPSTCAKLTVPRGGNELLLINSELRFPLNMIKQGLGIVTFYDGGNVFPRVGFRDFTSLYSNNVGIGFRYATPVGPVRIDIGRNLNPVPGISPNQYFITLGQAF